MWVVMAQEEDGAMWEDRGGGWGEGEKRGGGAVVKKCTEGWMAPGTWGGGRRAVRGSAGQHGEVGQCGPR